jgi:hypothetical protein
LFFAFALIPDSQQDQLARAEVELMDSLHGKGEGDTDSESATNDHDFQGNPGFATVGSSRGSKKLFNATE